MHMSCGMTRFLGWLPGTEVEVLMKTDKRLDEAQVGNDNEADDWVVTCVILVRIVDQFHAET